MKKRLKCIMLIDDDEDDNYFHEIVLKKMNIVDQIEIAETGLEALDHLKTETFVPDIIFLDINMPGMNGWEFLLEYRKLNVKKLKPIKLVMLTTSPNPDDEQKAKSFPEIIAFKRKPLTKDLILEIIAEHFPDRL